MTLFFNFKISHKPASLLANRFCVVFQTEVPLHEKNQQAIGLFFKMKDDYLALKSRMYYFPFNRLGNIPQIDFESAFASEA